MNPTQLMAVDLVGPFLRVTMETHIMVVAGDYFSRWMEAFPIPNQEAPTVAEKLVNEVFLWYLLLNGISSFALSSILADMKYYKAIKMLLEHK